MDISTFVNEFVPVRKCSDIDAIEELLLEKDVEECREFAETAAKFLSTSSSNSNSKWKYIADTKLSGYPVYCSYPPCRYDSIYRFASFAALYCDEAYVLNPFCYALEFDEDYENPLSGIRGEVAFSIWSTLSICPLLERGILHYYEYYPERLCPDCLASLLSDPDAEAKPLSFKIQKYFSETSVGRLFADNKTKRGISITLDESHDEHDLVFPRCPSIFDEKSIGDKLSAEEILHAGLFWRTAHILTHDMMRKNIFADQFGASNVFANSAEIQQIASFAGAEVHRSQFKPDFPLITAMNFADAVKVRDAEWHHLSDFRTAIQELKESEGGAIDDLGKVEIDKIYRVVARAQRSARNDLVESVPLAVLSITAAVATSGLSNVVSAAAGVLGGGHAASKMIPALRKKIALPEEARESRFYYAWRVGRAISHDRRRRRA